MLLAWQSVDSILLLLLPTLVAPPFDFLVFVKAPSREGHFSFVFTTELLTMAIGASGCLEHTSMCAQIFCLPCRLFKSLIHQDMHFILLSYFSFASLYLICILL